MRALDGPSRPLGYRQLLEEVIERGGALTSVAPSRSAFSIRALPSASASAHTITFEMPVGRQIRQELHDSKS
jgi:hypothetical protein